MNVFKIGGKYVSSSNENLQTLLRPIQAEADTLYWATWQDSFTVGRWHMDGNNEDILDEYFVDTVELFRASNLYLHRPGMMSKYGNALVMYELSHFIGFRAKDDKDADLKAAHLYGIIEKNPDGSLIEEPPGDCMIENIQYRNRFEKHGLIYVRFDAYTGPDPAFWMVGFNDENGILSKPFLEYHSNKPDRVIDKL